VWLESDVFKWGEKCFGDEDALKSDEENVWAMTETMKIIIHAFS
jgi:hypothetical protein